MDPLSRTSTSTPVRTSTSYQAHRRATSSPPEFWCRRQRRRDALEEAVHQVPVDFFLGHNGILPQLKDGINIAHLMLRLQDANLINERRYMTICHDLSHSDTSKHMSYGAEQVQTIVDAVQMVRNDTEEPTFTLKYNPDAHSDSHNCDRDRQPDCYGVLTSVTSNTCSTRKPRWIEIAILGELEETAQGGNDFENWGKMLQSFASIMQIDPRRRFAFGFTIEDTHMRIWFANRAMVMVSLPFDFIIKFEYAVEFFLRLMYAEESQLGWDPSITRVTPADCAGDAQYTIECAGTKYKTVRLLSDVGAEALCGRGTRVWEVREIKANGEENPKPLALKDSWADASREREGEILQKIREDALKSGAATPETFDMYFVKVRAYGDVYVKCAPDYAQCLIRCDHPSRGQNEGPFEVEVDPSPITRPSSSAGFAVASMIPVDHVQTKLVLYGAKIHHRTIYDEIGTPITDTDTLSKSLYFLSYAVRGLSILHNCGWVHRDISTGNILVVDEIGKLSDFEYAQQQNDTSRHDLRVGTPFFMATEVEKQYYLHGVKKLDKADNAMGNLTLEESRSRYLALMAKRGAPRTFAARDAAKGCVIRPKRPLAPTMRSDPVFRHNPLHDLESILWTGAWLLIGSNFINQDLGLSDEQWTLYLSHHRKYANELLDVRHRLFALFSPVSFLSGFRDLLPQVWKPSVMLDDIRRRLLVVYHDVNSRMFDSGQHVPFQHVATTMYDTMITRLAEAACELLETGNDLRIRALSSVEQRFIIQNHSTQSALATSTGEKRSAEEAQLENVDSLPRKREKRSK